MSEGPLLIALDFDGVLVDSGQEVLKTAFACWKELHPESRLSLSSEPDQKWISAFHNLMPFGSRAEDFGVALAAIEQHEIPENQMDYEHFKKQLGSLFLRSFHSLFYTVRLRRQQEDLEAWIALHHPYRPILKILSERSPCGTLVLATSKDENSARILLRSWGISRLFPPGHIYDKERGERKSAHLKAIIDDFGTDATAIRFIDDKVKNLSAAAEIGVHGILAGWGHNTRREHVLAAKKGFDVADFENVEHLLFG